MLTVASILLGLAASLFLVRLLRGPSVADRVIATDALVLVAVAGIAVQTALTGSGVFVDIALVLSLVAFVGTGVAALFVERRGA